MASGGNPTGSDTNLADILKDLKTKVGNASDDPMTEVRSEKSKSEASNAVMEEVSSAKKVKKEPGLKTGGGKKRAAPTPSPSMRKTRRSTKASDAEEKGETEEKVEGKRDIASELVIDRSFLVDHQLLVVNELLVAQGWDHLFREEVMMDENVVREFYENFKLEKMPGLWIATFVVKGEGHVLTHKQLAKILEVSVEGYEELSKGNWPATVAKASVIQKVGEDPKNNSGQGNSTKMGIVNRILHQFLVHNLTPRSSKHTTINYQDFLLINCLLEKEKISLPKQILLHMESCLAEKTMSLPYPGVVRKILVDFGIYDPAIETVMSETLNTSFLSNIKWKYDEEKGWVNPRVGTLQAKAETPVVGTQPEKQSEASPEVIALMKGTIEKLEVIAEKVVKLESLGERMSAGHEFDWAKDLGEKAAIIETIPKFLKDLEASVNLNLSNSIQIKEELVNLNKQLKLIVVEFVGPLKRLLGD